jgi:hypothetical protein
VTAAGQNIGIKSQRRSSKRSFGENTTSCARIGPTSNNVLYGGRDNLHLASAVPRGAHLYGMACHDRGLVSAEISDLGRLYRRRRLRYFRV